jgi:hypothetical protein
MAEYFFGSLNLGNGNINIRPKLLAGLFPPFRAAHAVHPDIDVNALMM